VAVEPPLCCSPSRVICASEELLALRASFGQSNRNRLLTAPDLDVTALATAPHQRRDGSARLVVGPRLSAYDQRQAAVLWP
jgi:hypothetical protein